MQILEISHLTWKSRKFYTQLQFLISKHVAYQELQPPTVHRSLAGFETFQGTFGAGETFVAQDGPAVCLRSSGLVGY